jgi:hypothetical protein
MSLTNEQIGALEILGKATGLSQKEVAELCAQAREANALREKLAACEKDAVAFKQKFEASREFLEKVFRLFRPVTQAFLWERVDDFGADYNKKLSEIDAARKGGERA